MNGDEKDAFLSALRRMFEDNINPYRAVNDSFTRGIERAKAERDWWNQFLPGRSGPTATIEVERPGRAELRIRYAPAADGDPQAGEIVWTWVPLDAGRRGAYCPALILGRANSDRYHAVRLSTKSHEGEHRFFAIGAGPKDSRGRLSWVDIDHIVSVHADGMRREDLVMDRDHFTRLADELYLRHGWAMED